MPSGVFKPYAGVSTAIIVFAKGGKTDTVFFFDVESDGFTLDDKRAKIGDGRGDLPDVLAKYVLWRHSKMQFNDRTAKAFEVHADDLRAQGYDLSINRYKQQVHAEQELVDPRSLLRRLQDSEAEIIRELAALEELLR